MPSSIRKALNELPTTLDETYERALEWIPKEKRQHAHRLFQCLVVAIRPLRVEELAEIFAIEFDTDAGPNLKEGWRPVNAEDAVLSACSTLIAVIENEGSKIVQFSHFSVKEYLTSDRLRTSEMGGIRHYHIPLDDAHTILARASLAVLLQLDENVDEKRLSTFPLAFYAAQHWVDHAKYEDVASRIRDVTEQLFHPSKPYLASWTWVHDVDLYRAGKTIHDLEGRPERPRATALYYAALCGFGGLANYLIITHAENVNAKCGKHETPLHAASYKGHLDAARVLLAHGADVNTTNTSKKTPLCSAYDGGHLDAMRLLLEHGADVDVYYDEVGLLSHEASWRGRADVVHLLLQHNADVNAGIGSSGTPLGHAAFKGQARVAQLLLEHGALVNSLDSDRNTPLHSASCLEVAQLLLEHGALVNSLNSNCNTPLHTASVDGNLEVVRILLGHGADVHVRGGGDLTPFEMATSIVGHDGVAQLLLEHGAKKE
jgi:ankyrin repeat protein